MERTGHWGDQHAALRPSHCVLMTRRHSSTVQRTPYFIPHNSSRRLAQRIYASGSPKKRPAVLLPKARQPSLVIGAGVRSTRCQRKVGVPVRTRLQRLLTLRAQLAETLDLSK